MNPFWLYYLVNQSGLIDGDKTLTGKYPDLASAQAKAIFDGIAHYSVENNIDDGENFSIVYIV